MSIQCTFAANHLPETKMRWYPTQVINVVVERGGAFHVAEQDDVAQRAFQRGEAVFDVVPVAVDIADKDDTEVFEQAQGSALRWRDGVSG